MVTNEAGQVALRHRRQTDKHVRLGDGTEYVFVVQRHVSIAFVDPKHVDQVLRITRNCCGNSNKPIFTYASESDIRIWTGQGGR